MQRELTLALVLVIVAAVATTSIVYTINAADAKSNKAFGKCVSNAAKNNISKTVCNPLKRGHPFTVHNETSSD